MPLAGVDEAGCAPLAGPVVAAAVVLDREKFPRGIDDSKVLPAPVREAICARLYRSRESASASPASRRSTGSTSTGRGCWR
jgi:ribonuclease HII